MRRWKLTPGKTGLDALVMDTVPDAHPAEGQVRIRVRAASLNFRDQLVLADQYGVPREHDLVPLSDGAGEIDSVGPGVEGWRPGDRVAGLYFSGWTDGPPPSGGPGLGLGAPGEEGGLLAEQVILAADRVARIPDRYDYVQAASLPCAGLTAWTSLFGGQPIGPDSSVLVLGTGGVATFALSFAAAAGAEVFATSGSDAKLDLARRLGASDGVNYREHPDWGDVIFARSGGVDKVVDTVGGAALDGSIAALAPGGEIALMGLFAGGDDPPLALPILMMKGGSIRGVAVGNATDFEAMVSSIEESRMEPPINATFTFDEAKQAYAAAADADRFGKVVISIP